MNRLIAYLFVLLLMPFAAMAQQSPQMLAKPKTGYVLDKAKLLDAATVAKINSVSATSAKTHDSPIYVVTIPSVASVHGFDIVTYANELFDAWGVGSSMSNKGILLLISKGDRKARIALGAGWRYTKDNECLAIMNQKIVPRFKAGDYPGGALSGVQALSQMAKGKALADGEVVEFVSDGGTATTYYPSEGTTFPGDQFNVSSGLSGLVLCPLLPVAVFILIVIANLAGGGGGYSNRRNSGWFNSSGGWGSHHYHHHHGGSIFGGSSSSSSSSRSSSSGSRGGGHSGGGGASGSW